MLLWIPSSKSTKEICLLIGTAADFKPQTVSVKWYNTYNTLDETRDQVRCDEESTNDADDTVTNRLPIV